MMTPQPFNGPRLRRTPAAAFSFAALSISQARKKSRPILAFSPNCNFSQLFPQKTDKSDSRSLHFRYISPARTCHSPHLQKQKNATVHELHHDGGIKCSIDFSFPWRTSQMHVNFVQGLHIVVTQPFDAIDHLHKSCPFLFDFSAGSYPKVTDAR